MVLKFRPTVNDSVSIFREFLSGVRNVLFPSKLYVQKVQYEGGRSRDSKIVLSTEGNSKPVGGPVGGCTLLLNRVLVTDLYLRIGTLYLHPPGYS